MTSEDRPTLSDEDRGTVIPIEVDVPRERYEEAVAEARRLNALPEEERFGKGPVTVDQRLIDSFDFDIRYFVDGEEAPVGVPDEGEAWE